MVVSNHVASRKCGLVIYYQIERGKGSRFFYFGLGRQLLNTNSLFFAFSALRLIPLHGTLSQIVFFCVFCFCCCDDSPVVGSDIGHIISLRDVKTTPHANCRKTNRRILGTLLVLPHNKDWRRHGGKTCDTHQETRASSSLPQCMLCTETSTLSRRYCSIEKYSASCYYYKSERKERKKDATESVESKQS